MKTRNIILVGSCPLLILVLFFCFQWNRNKKVNSVSNNKNIPIELIYTDNELAETSKWKNRSYDDLMKDAFNGDRAALYNLGMYLLAGIELTINVNQANLFFSQSASLGFAPALDQIAKMYINDESNAFLGLVYTNLTIAFGHTELTQGYHDFRNEILKNFGQITMTEVERLAAEKMLVILKNQEDQEGAVNKKEFYASMKNIINEDLKYKKDYWLKLYQKNKDLTKTPWYLNINSLDTNEETKEFLRLATAGFLKVPEMLSYQISNADIQNYLEHNLPELMRTKIGQRQICSDLRRLSSIPCMKKEAMDEIINEHGGDPQNLTFDLENAVYRRVGSQIEKIIREFKLGIKF